MTQVELERHIADSPWTLEDGRGNHRILVRVAQAAPYVHMSVKWRRRDYNPENTALVLIHNETETKVKNILPVQITREQGEIFFEAPYAGEYALYYYPYHQKSQNWWFPIVDYTWDNVEKPDAEWVENAPETAPEAEVLCEESRTEFDSFYPMEVPATAEEMQEILAGANGAPWLTFTEERRYPVRMFHEIPYRWVGMGTSSRFSGTAQPDEYYVFQLVLWTQRPVHHITVDFRLPEGSMIDRKALTCFQTEGVDWLGHPFTRELDLEENFIQPFWIGVDLPKDQTGKLEFQTIIHTDCGDQVFDVDLEIQGENLPHRGDHELWRLSRLRWLNSTIGLDDETTEPFPPMEVSLDQHEVDCAGKQYQLGEDGLPRQIQSHYNTVGKLCEDITPILSQGLSFTLTANGKPVEMASEEYQVQQKGTGSVLVCARQQGAGVSLHTESTVEYDGHADTLLTVTALEDITLDDAQLSFAISPECSSYMMGMGREGGETPDSWEYTWQSNRTNNFLWAGGANGGLHIKLKHTQDVWELYTYEEIGLPESWDNHGKGGCRITREADGLHFVAFTGERTLKKGESVTFRYALLPSPLFPLNSDAHWRDRYDHPGEKSLDLESSVAGGATVVNLHQGERYNRYINYPFCEDEPLKKEIQKAHEMGLRYKLYYTVRELTTHAAEFWVIRSLGNEILMQGHSFRVAEHFIDEFFNQDTSNPSTGGPWVCEHLPEGYVPAWQTIFKDKDYDCSVATVGLSRWHNYYLEGLRWLVGELDADGIYLDGVGYDRQIMKRVRKVMNHTKKGCLVDLHSGNNFHPQYGLCNVLGEYMELLPSVDSLWIGEAFDYEGTSPAYWLTEVTGIPFGLMGDMLHRGGNKWRGMVFGMTPRCNWPEGGSPLPIWELWKEFGMEGCTVQGWWSAECPVSISNPNIKATAFVQKDRALIAVASWNSETVTVPVEIDFDKLPFTGDGVSFRVPAISEFQNEEPCAAVPVLTIEPGKGKIVILQKNA